MLNGLLLVPDWHPKTPDEPDQALRQFDQRYLLISQQVLHTCPANAGSDFVMELLPDASTDLADSYNHCAARLHELLQTIIQDTDKPTVCVQLILPQADHPSHGALVGLTGLIKTVCKESSRIHGQVLLVPEHTTVDRLMLLADDNVGQPERLIRYVHDQREVEIWRDTPSTHVDCPWVRDGVYLITGGLGGLGYLFAKDIAEQTESATLILTGRSALNDASQERLDSLNGNGLNTHYVQADVSDRQQVDQLMQSIHQSHQRLDGIIHSAGVVQDGLLRSKNLAQINQVLAPKVAGLIHLDQASRELLQGPLVAFSSASAALGNVGQSDYATANGFMDAYATQRNAQASHNTQSRIVSINWPLWRDGGMQVDQQKLNALESAGLRPLETPEGIQACYLAIQSHHDQLMVMAGVEAKIRALIGDAPAPRDTAMKSSSNETDPQETLKNQLLDYLKTCVKTALKVPTDRINSHAPLEQYGIDSVMVMHITEELEHTFGRLSKTLLFEYQTLAELCDYLWQHYPEVIASRFGATAAPKPHTAVEPPGTATQRRPKGRRFVTQQPKRHRDIAIIGLAGQYPGADTPEAFWKKLSQGYNGVSEIPAERWDHTPYFNPDKNRADTTYSKWGGFIDKVDQFDALFFNVSPKEAARLDPQERLFLQTAYHTFEDAGYNRDALAKQQALGLAGNVGVYVGVMYNEYQLYGAEAQAHDQRLALSATSASIANRVSYFFNLHGPSMVVDTMCSSSLTAIHLACESLMAEGCQMALAGGVNLSLHPNKYLLLGQGKFASSKGLCESFAEGGDGYVPGEGVGAVLLKPLEHALKDGDHIYGVIKSSVINHGGKTNGYTVPNPNAQANVIDHAIQKSGISPRDISYIEAHGTGTSLGDPIEITGLSKAFAKHTQDKQFCAIGSVKSNIGHCESAAGIAGLTKVLMQFKHQQLAPSIHAERLNPNIDFEATPFTVQRTLASWHPSQNQGNVQARIAGLSSFGAGGSNAHLIISEFEPSTPRLSPSEHLPAIVILSGKKEDRLVEQARRLLHALQHGQYTDGDLLNMAYTLQVGRDPMPYRFACTAMTVAQLQQQLQAFLNHDTTTDAHWGKTDSGHEEHRPSADIGQLKAQRQWQQLMEQWVSGDSVHWTDLYEDQRPQRISLPTYPFADTRYWVRLDHQKTPHQDEPTMTLEPTSDGTCYRLTLTGKEPFLSDHHVNGSAVLPGVAYLELVYQALAQHTANETANPRSWVVKDLVWLRPLVVNDLVDLHVTLEGDLKGAMNFDITQQGESAEPIVHCRGKIQQQTMGQQPTLDLHHIQANCNGAIISHQALYQRFANIHLDYGPTHRLVQRLQLGENQVFARLQRTDTAADNDYLLHPGLLDAALQATIGLSDEQQSNTTALPFSIEGFTSYQTLPANAWVQVRYNPAHRPGAQISKIDLDISDEQGNVCARIQGFSTRQLQVSAPTPPADTTPVAQAATPSTDTLESLLADTVCELLEVPLEDIDNEVELSEYGFDSVSFTQFSSTLNQRFGLNLSPTVFFEYPTLQALADYLRSNFSHQLSTALPDTPPTENTPIESTTRFVTENTPPLPDSAIAIIGMSGQFPMAHDLDAFWDNLKSGKDCISEIPGDRWDWQTLYGDPKKEPGKTDIKWGGFIEGVDQFDPLFFGISPKEAQVIDPQQRLLMKYVWQALEDAGYAASDLSGSDLALLIGTGNSGYSNLIARAGEAVQGYHATSTVPSVGPNRMSHFLDVHGPSEPIETACSSSLVAVHRAVQLLRSGQCRMAVVGGVNTILTPAGHISFGKAGMLSPDGRCKTFSEDANGYVRGEGVGMLVLKPLADAERDGDPIHAVIRGSAQNHGGRSQSLTAPNTKAQTALLQAAYRDAQIDPNSVTYIEAHGTGTSLGDPIEIDGLKAAFNQPQALTSHCGIGSVKTNIGHLELAAGVAGIIKTVLQLKHKTLVKSLHCDRINPYIDLDQSPFYVVQETQHWPTINDAQGNPLPRRTGISSFGFGGVNAHVVLEEYLPTPPVYSLPQHTPMVIVLSAKTPSALKARCQQLIHAIEQQTIHPQDLPSLAYTLQVGRNAMEERLGFIATELAQVSDMLRAYLNDDHSAGYTRGSAQKQEEKQPEITSNTGFAHIVDAWCKGRRVQWSCLYANGLPARRHLPSYPFDDQRCWVTASTTDMPSDNHAAPGDLKSAAIEHLKTITGRVLNIPTSQLDAARSLDQYGVDSIMVVTLADELNASFRSIDSSLLFEMQTLEQLADYLLQHEADAVEQLLGDAPATTVAQHEAPTPVRSKHAISRASVSTLGDVAIIGLTGRYAQANNLQEFWAHLKAGKNCISEIPADRWNWRDHYAKERGKIGSIYSKWGGFIPDADKFDPLFFSITPRDAEWMDPQERVFIEASYHCLEDAGYTPKGLTAQGKVGVFVGVMNGNYSTGAKYWSIANRVSYLFDFKGPSLAVDTACSSSLTAIHLAMESLRNGSCTTALAGGVNLIVDPAHYRGLSAASMLSASDECKAFGSEADGFVDGEGVGAVLLKPLEQAARDGDHIYGVIKGSMINAGGKTTGFTVPSVTAQAEVITEALTRANVNAADIDYIEAHGTGTPLGDPIEISGLSKAFRTSTNRVGDCPIGSVKSNIGHCESAAGIAGLSKVLLQFKHQQLVPSLHSQELNARIPFEGSPFVVQQHLSSWATPLHHGQPRARLAGISSFGAGGANAHVIVEEYRSASAVPNEQNAPVLIPLSAKSLPQLKQRANDLLEVLQAHPNLSLTDLAYTLQVGREAFEYRFACVADSQQALVEQLSAFCHDQHASPKGHQGNTTQPSHHIAHVLDASNNASLIHDWMQQGDYDKVLQCWVNGIAVDWSELYQGNTPRRMPLPGYPFARERYWFKRPKVTNPSNPPISEAQQTINTAAASTQSLVYFSPQWVKRVVPSSNHPVEYAQHVVVLSETFAEHQTTLRDASKHVIVLPSPSENRGESYERIALSLLQALKLALKACANGQVLLQVVVSDTDSSQGAYGLSSMLKTARKEHPKLVTQWLQLPPQTAKETFLKYLNDSAVSPDDAMIRHHHEQRDVCLWRERHLPVAQAPWQTDGVYLITGGAGGLGELFACDMAEKTEHVTLLLTGRRPMDGAIRATIQRLQQYGATVEYHQTDVSDTEATRQLMSHIRQHHQRLDGIIHSAGVIHDGLIVSKDDSAFIQVLQPKVRGTITLDQASRGLLNGPFILFGSSAGAFGNMGQVDYAAANGFMDGFAQSRQVPSSPTLCIDWPLWQEGGMQVDTTKHKMLERVGLEPLTTQAGIQACYQALASQETQIVLLAGDPTSIRQLVPAVEHTQPSDDAGIMNTPPQAGALETNTKADAITYIKGVLSEVVKLPPEKISIKTPLEEYGVDSIAVMQIIAALENDLGELPKTLLFEHPSVDQLAAYLTQHHANALAQTADTGATLSPSTPPAENTPSPRRVNAAVEQDIAIIGLAGRYPQADTLEVFWNNLKTGKDCVGEVPQDRWDHEHYFAPHVRHTGGQYSRWGGFLTDIDKFDPLFFKISPLEAAAMDPQERLFLQCAYHTMEDAGYTRQSLNQRHDGTPQSVGVYVGVMYQEYQLYAAQEQLLGNTVTAFGNPSSIANRVSYFGDFHGPSMAIDTMCSSSLTAIHLACESLLLGHCDTAIAGGVNLTPHPNKYLVLGQSNFTSSNGRCQAFGRDGDGYVPSEGVGAVLLKPLQQAINDGDHVYGVIKSSAINHGGKSSGYTVPSPTAQAQVIHKAIERSGVPVEHISYVEAHGTGTSLGDPIEIAGLNQAFGAHDGKTSNCAIGSVKSNIGHAESAAGIAGLTKVLLQMQHRTLVPSIHCEELNPYIDFEHSPFTVQRETREWHPVDTFGAPKPLIAGLSSFGAGGSNAHLIVSEYPREPSPVVVDDDQQPHIILLSARTSEALQERVSQLHDALLTQPLAEQSLRDIAYTLQVGREPMPNRVAFVCSNHAELIQRMRDYLNGNATDQTYHGTIKPTQDAAELDALEQQVAEELPMLLSQGDPMALLPYWIKGADIPWHRLYKHPMPQRLSLPLYPFKKTRCWLNTSAPHATPLSSDPNESSILAMIDRIRDDDIQEQAFIEWMAAQ